MADKKDDQPVLMTLNTLSSRMSVPKSRSLPPMGHHCPHCEEVLTAKTYKQHKRLFFNAESGKWTKEKKDDELCKTAQC